MYTQNCLRYDAVQDRYQHLEDGKEGKYHGLSKHLAGLIRNASRAKRALEPLVSGQTMVTGRVK